MISCNRLTAGTAALLLALAITAGCAGSPSRQSTGDVVDDTVVTTKVKTALVRADEVDAMDVQVKTFKGVVQLSGFADSDQERERAAIIAEGVAGVKRVQNDIRLKN